MSGWNEKIPTEENIGELWELCEVYEDVSSGWKIRVFYIEPEDFPNDMHPGDNFWQATVNRGGFVRPWEPPVVVPKSLPVVGYILTDGKLDRYIVELPDNTVSSVGCFASVTRRKLENVWSGNDNAKVIWTDGK